MPDPLLTATYVAGLVLMSRSARAGAAAAQRAAADAADRAEKMQKEQQDRAITAQIWATTAAIAAQRRNMEDGAVIARRDRAWPLIRPAEDVVASLAQSGSAPLVVFFAPTPGATARGVHDAAVSALRSFIRRSFGSAAPTVVVSNEWDVVAQRGMDDAAIGALAAGMPQQPFIVLSLCHTSPQRVEVLAAYHPGDGTPVGQITRLADSAVSLRDLVAEAVRRDCDAWNAKAIPVATKAGFSPQAVAELLGQDGIRNLRLRALEEALSDAGIDAGSLNLDGRYHAERLEDIAQPALEAALQLAVAILADGHNLLVRRLPPRAISHLVPIVAGAPPALRESTRHVLSAYRTVLRSASSTAAEAATFGLLQLAMAHADLRDAASAATAIEDALDSWIALREIPKQLISNAVAGPERVAPLLTMNATSRDAPLVRLFAAAVAETRAAKDAALLRRLADRLEGQASKS